MTISTRFVGTGRALGARRVDNAELATRVEGVDDAWIRARVGVAERCFVAEGQSGLDLAETAAREALAAASLAPEQLDAIVVATVTAEQATPSCAARLGARLDLHGPAAFDLGAACAGFVYALGLVDGCLRAGTFKKVLIVGVDVMSRVLDFADRNTAVIFGDGAGAAVLVAEADASSRPRGILACRLRGDGSRANLLGISPDEQVVKMRGPALFHEATHNVAAINAEVLAAAGLQPLDIDLVIAHQANLRLVEAVAARSGLPLERFHNNIDRYGNTSGASIPIALDEAVRQGRIAPGGHVLFSALGAGLVWGAAIARW
jgi:3-oxoacyl-[acyl-carrier-protein] synthase-3